MKMIPLNTVWNVPSVFDEDWWTYPQSSKDLFPQIDMEDTEKELVIHAGVPGFDQNDIKVRVQKGKLIISGKKSEEIKKEDKKYYYREMTTAEFHRTVSLPVEVDNVAVSAKIDNGILKINLPKIIRPEEQEVEIKIS